MVGSISFCWKLAQFPAVQEFYFENQLRLTKYNDTWCYGALDVVQCYAIDSIVKVHDVAPSGGGTS